MSAGDDDEQFFSDEAEPKGEVNIHSTIVDVPPDSKFTSCSLAFKSVLIS